MPTPLLSIDIINKRKPIECILTAFEYDLPHYSRSGISRSVVKVKCNCGNLSTAIVCDLIRGKKLSCGCIKRGAKIKYSIQNKNIYKVWYDMNRRCNDLSNKYYGAKGVKVCQEWTEYQTFANWAINNGYKKGLQLDKDTRGNGLLYSPGTCCFLTPLQNSNNRSTSKKYKYNNEYLTLSQIALKSNVSYYKLKARMYGQRKTLLQAIGIG